LTKLDSQGKKIWFKDPYGTSRSDLGSVAVNSEDKILVLAGNGDLKIYSPEGDLQVDQSNFDNGNVDWAWYNGAQGVGKNFFIGGRIRDSIPKPVVYLVDEKSSVLQKDIWSVEGKSQILTIKYDKITKTALAVGQIDWEGKNYLYTKLYK